MSTFGDFSTKRVKAKKIVVRHYLDEHCILFGFGWHYSVRHHSTVNCLRAHSLFSPSCSSSTRGIWITRNSPSLADSGTVNFWIRKSFWRAAGPRTPLSLVVDVASWTRPSHVVWTTQSPSALRDCCVSTVAPSRRGHCSPAASWTSRRRCMRCCGRGNVGAWTTPRGCAGSWERWRPWWGRWRPWWGRWPGHSSYRSGAAPVVFQAQAARDSHLEHHTDQSRASETTKPVLDGKIVVIKS